MDDRLLQSIMSDIKEYALVTFKQATPYDTGDQQRSIYNLDLPNGGFETIIGTDYAKHTTDPRTDGKTNPNEGWAQRAQDKVIRYAESRFSAYTINRD